MQKPIFIILIAITVSIALVFYWQKRGAEQHLKRLVEHGKIVISEHINALPIVIIDETHQSVHLLAGQKHQPLRFADIKEIKLYESAEKGNNASEKMGPDYGTISTFSGEHFRFDNLQVTAKALYQQLKQYPALTDKTQFINNR